MRKMFHLYIQSSAEFHDWIIDMDGGDSMETPGHLHLAYHHPLLPVILPDQHLIPDIVPTITTTCIKLIRIINLPYYYLSCTASHQMRHPWHD